MEKKRFWDPGVIMPSDIIIFHHVFLIGTIMGWDDDDDERIRGSAIL